MSTRNIIAARAASGQRRITGLALARDALAGLTLAAIAIPEQMATARLAHFPAEIGFLAFLAGTLGFLLFGASRVVSVGADSTIAPIFAASLALVAVAGSPDYAAQAAILAVMTGLLVTASGFARLGWISNLLSAPVTAGFLAGISVHIIASQLPVLCGVPAAGGDPLHNLARTDFSLTNPYAALIGASAFLLTAAAEMFDRRWPGALIGIAGATIATLAFALERHGVQVLGAIAPPDPRLLVVPPDASEIARLAPLALLLALVIMVQSATTSRSFPPDSDQPPDIDRDFVGVGAGNILAGLTGAFPVNASPPRTAVATEAGAQSKTAGLVAAGAVALLALFGSNLLRNVPSAALAGLLLFVALRIIKFDVVRAAWRESKSEFLLIPATALAIVVFPIEIGVGTGILLSLLHGMWTTTRAQVITLERVPNTTIWWPPSFGAPLQRTPGVLVLAFQAPLSFLNANAFRRGFKNEIAHAPSPVHLVVLEASSIVEIDFTAAHAMRDIVRQCREEGILFAVARLESIRAQRSFRRFGIVEAVGPSHIYQSVNEAVEALAPGG